MRERYERKWWTVEKGRMGYTTRGAIHAACKLLGAFHTPLSIQDIAA